MSLLHKTARLITIQRLVSSFGRSNGHHRSQLCDVRHCSSSPVHSSSSDSDRNPPVNTASDCEWYLLYERSASRLSYPRATLAFSSFNALYWMWYTFDFTPSVNAAAYEKAALNQIDAETLELLLVDSSMGYVGLGLALVIWGGSVWYPKHLVSAIWKSGDNLAVSTLSMPFVKAPSILGGENSKFTAEQLKLEPGIQFYKAGEISITGEREKNELLVKLDGDLGKKRGHLALQLRDPNAEQESGNNPLTLVTNKNYLLDIGSQDEIVEGANADLLSVLLHDDLGEKQSENNNSRRRQKLEDNSDDEYVQIRPKFGKGKKRR